MSFILRPIVIHADRTFYFVILTDQLPVQISFFIGVISSNRSVGYLWN